MQNPPAHAGNTLDKNATVTIAQDHPRLRGEYNHIKIDGQEYLGSPPLARGIHFLRKQSEPEIPITPACAGNTYQRSPERSVLRDHPRLRGEYEQKSQGERLAKGSPPACAGNTIEIIQFRMKKKTGSPPLARGIPNGHIPATPLGRIIPACAGNTHSCFHGKAILWDHPRLRGEYIPRRKEGSAAQDHPRLRGEYAVFHDCSASKSGSPPLTRGIQTMPRQKMDISRITPAYAGNTDALLRQACARRDHPRLRGENAGILCCAFDNSRITPACAGKTVLRSIAVARSWDHPRLRGENFLCLCFLLARSGSPPLARGKLI